MISELSVNEWRRNTSLKRYNGNITALTFRTLMCSNNWYQGHNPDIDLRYVGPHLMLVNGVMLKSDRHCKPLDTDGGVWQRKRGMIYMYIKSYTSTHIE